MPLAARTERERFRERRRLPSVPGFVPGLRDDQSTEGQGPSRQMGPYRASCGHQKRWLLRPVPFETMPLFDLSTERPRPFRRLNSSAEVYEQEIERLFWDDLEAFAGEPLFAVARQPRIPGGGIPDIVALDPAGRVVVVEVKRDIDRSQLAQCLEYAGWARRTSLDGLAALYEGGPTRFFPDWQQFTGTETPVVVAPVPRLLLVARSFDGRTQSAFEFLQEHGVPVGLVKVVFYEDSHGSRIVDVDNGAEARPVVPVPLPVPPRANSGSSRVVGVSLADLLEAGLLVAGEPIEWRRPQMGVTYSATVTERGDIVTEDGRAFASLSMAADNLSGGSHNGWECWAVPRLGGVKMIALRSTYLGRAESPPA